MQLAAVPSPTLISAAAKASDGNAQSETQRNSWVNLRTEPAVDTFRANVTACAFVRASVTGGRPTLAGIVRLLVLDSTTSPIVDERRHGIRVHIALRTPPRASYSDSETQIREVMSTTT